MREGVSIRWCRLGSRTCKFGNKIKELVVHHTEYLHDIDGFAACLLHEKGG